MSRLSGAGLPENIDTHKPPVIVPDKEYRSGQKFYGDQYFGTTTYSGYGLNHRFLPKAGLTAYDGMKKVMQNTTTIYDSKRVEISKEESHDDDDGDYDEEADDILSTEGRPDQDGKESIDSTK